MAKKLHFVGIGGIGMSGIAEILLSLGYRISGSDVASSLITAKLEKLGAKIFIGHDGKNIAGAESVIFSSAVSEENPELLAAREQNIPILKRAVMLAELMRLKNSVAVAGTHGKTTTTSILATILKENSFDPTYIIGGIVHNLAGHANAGKGDYLVAEADESDASFLLLNPVMSVITNIDFDHMDCYGSEEALKEAFLTFVNNMRPGGRCAININDQNLRSLVGKFKCSYVGFGVKEDCRRGERGDYLATNISYKDSGMNFDLLYESEKVCDIYLPTPGKHNVLNALGAISMAHCLGVDFARIKSSIATFSGVNRRVEVLVERDGFEVIDDYAHHPTEVAVTLKTVRAIRPEKKLVVVFEPHRFTRTQYCWDDFQSCFDGCDKVYICPIYAAGEEEIPEITAENLSREINLKNSKHSGLSEALSDTDDMSAILESFWGREVTLLTLGAGSIGRRVREWIADHA